MSDSDPAGTCELVQFKVSGARFLHISPRPRAGAPSDLEQTLLQQVKDALEHESHTCGEGCDCSIGEPVAVASRTQIKKVSDGDYTAWYQVTLTKYRSPGECMPAGDTLPEGVRGA
jgi:hypothetical protein